MQAEGLHLGALEARTAPSDRWVEVRDEVRAFARQAATFQPRPGDERPEIGLVLHFVKTWERPTPAGPRLHGDPGNAWGTRFGPWFVDQSARAAAIAAALESQPELLLVLRGIDVANVELAQPTWVVRPLFERVRAASREAAARLARRRPTWGVRPLRATVHAGEDYRRLVEGLRRIHEPIELGLIEAGDRLGHAIALGARIPFAGRRATRTVVQLRRRAPRRSALGARALPTRRSVGGRGARGAGARRGRQARPRHLRERH